jgi:CHAT domain-containing protein
MHSPKSSLRLSLLLALVLPIASLLIARPGVTIQPVEIAQTQTMKDRKAEADRLFEQGSQQFQTSQFEAALQSWQQALVIYQTIKDRKAEGWTLGNLGNAYYYLGNYAKDIEYLHKVLIIAQEINDRQSEGLTLRNLGIVYRILGNYAKAINYYQQALVIAREIKNSYDEGWTLGSLGDTYYYLGDLTKAISYYHKHLVIAQELNDRRGKGAVLGSLGNAYQALGQYEKAIEYQEQGVAIARELKDRQFEGVGLQNLGSTYNDLAKYAKAIEYSQQSLAIAREIKDRESEGIVLSNIGVTLAKQQQPELAIVFYKQSVNVRESIRGDIHKLPREQQATYTKKIADDYRTLADLLLKQNRVLEAQQVLDLLKVQELEDYLHIVRGTTGQGIPLLPTEQQIKDQYDKYIDQVIPIGQELAALQKVPYDQLSPAQKQRLHTLTQLQSTYQGSFNQFIQTPEILDLIARLTQQDPQQQSLNLNNLNKSRDNLKQVQQVLHINAVILYPLILKDRLELVLVTAGAPPIHKAVPVTQDELNHAISAFLSDLKDPRSNPQPNAQKLYRWLIQPIKAELEQTQTQTIFYAPDDQLRYIPLAALHDGKQYLVEQFQINNIISTNLQAIQPLPPFQPHVLAGAFATGSYTVRVADRTLTFQGLQFAGTEVRTLATLLPNTTTLLDKAFAKQPTVDQLSQYNIVHLATHGIFTDNGNPQDSFILFGDGDRATLSDVGSWDLSSIHLVVLSACQTATSATLGKGAPILGLGYQVQLARAQAAIASLWTVDDQGTQTLMDSFYTRLKQGNLTPAQALQQAQRSLLSGKSSNPIDATQRAALIVKVPGGTRNVNPLTRGFSHPYYWAPFILIGNGL